PPGGEDKISVQLRQLFRADVNALAVGDPLNQRRKAEPGVALLIAPRLNVLALGDKVALGLGVNLVQTRLLGLLAIALLCGAAVAVAGPIGFVGLVVPHVVRRLVTEDIRLALPLAAPVGALALVLADIAARTLVAPQELATGAMTALVGAPLFIFIAARFFK
ncbi:FecCD family ABC transporter permease, partial [Klebsiella pneumoniae]|uniref:FecCD family ABC transporter permease n=1 Tax=Klebsiella pneumoniae TaxID=573 RepID=UPI001E57527C